MLRKTIAVTIVSAALLTGCHSSPEPTPSASETATQQSPSASATPTPTAVETPAASPSPSVTPTPQWTVPADWTPIDPSEAGVDPTSVTAVLGAWQLDDGAVASVIVIPNDAGTTDPAKYFKATLADFANADDLKVTQKARKTDAGEPALVVTATPTEDNGGDAQQFIIVLRNDEVTWATVSDSPGALADSAGEMWELMRTLPAA
ncbi:MAG: hypothetical protein NVV57_06795 [Demequina sp.]|nr:hypothetical protein [Demequina sp.]